MQYTQYTWTHFFEVEMHLTSQKGICYQSWASPQVSLQVRKSAIAD